MNATEKLWTFGRKLTYTYHTNSSHLCLIGEQAFCGCHAWRQSAQLSVQISVMMRARSHVLLRSLRFTSAATTQLQGVKNSLVSPQNKAISRSWQDPRIWSECKTRRKTKKQKITRHAARFFFAGGKASVKFFEFCKSFSEYVEKTIFMSLITPQEYMDKICPFRVHWLSSF